MTQEKKTRETNQTTDRALELLGLFEKNKELGISEIADMMDLKKTNVTRLVASLEKYDFLHQNPDTKRYRLGYKLLLLGELVQERAEIGRILLSEMTEIAHKNKVSVTMMVNEGDSMRIVQKVDAGLIVNISARKGSCLPMHLTASGKLYLAFSSEERVNRYLKETKRTALTPYSITGVKELREEFARIRNMGYAFDNEENIIGLSCISVPLRGVNGNILATLSINAPTYLLEANKDVYLQDLSQAAKSFNYKN